MDLLKILRLRKHHLYMPPVKPIWKKKHSKCKCISKKDWPKIRIFPWQKPKYYEGGNDK